MRFSTSLVATACETYRETDSGIEASVDFARFHPLE